MQKPFNQKNGIY